MALQDCITILNPTDTVGFGEKVEGALPSPAVKSKIVILPRYIKMILFP